MSSKWTIRKDEDGIKIRGEDVYAIIDPKSVPNDAIDVDFIIVSERPKDVKKLERVWKASEATVVAPSSLGKKFERNAYVEVVKGAKGLTKGLWVYEEGGEIAVIVEGKEEYGVMAKSKRVLERAKEVAREVYGGKAKFEKLFRDVEEEEVR